MPEKILNASDKICLDTLKNELQQEKDKRIALEKELKLQVSLKAETDVAMKLLEKHLRDKEDTISSLRLQLDQIKQINLEMYRKLQVGKRSKNRGVQDMSGESFNRLILTIYNALDEFILVVVVGNSS